MNKERPPIDRHAPIWDLVRGHFARTMGKGGRVPAAETDALLVAIAPHWKELKAIAEALKTCQR